MFLISLRNISQQICSLNAVYWVTAVDLVDNLNYQFHSFNMAVAGMIPAAKFIAVSVNNGKEEAKNTSLKWNKVS